MKIAHVLLLLVFILGCKSKDKNIYEGENLCEIIKTMNEDDQEYRSLIRDPFYNILDSIKTAKKLTTEEVVEYIVIAKEIAQTRKLKFNEKEIDSIMVLQKKLDNKNAELLIDIIKKRGFPTTKNSICKTSPGFVLTHTQPEYWHTLNILIKAEIKKGNMAQSHYDFLIKHFEKKGLDINSM
jgi:hypothetical protein